MKNFDDFVEFLDTDCKLDINQVGINFDNIFTEADIKATGLSTAQLGKLLQMVGFTTSQSILMVLRRYHEWLLEFPDTDHTSDQQ